MQNDISVYELPNISLPREIIRWKLEHPTDGDSHAEPEQNVKGWVAGNFKELKICIREEGKNTWTEYKLSENRSDVIKKILNENPINHPQLMCGFNFKVKIQSFEIGLLINGKPFWVACINIKNKERAQNRLPKEAYNILKNRLLPLKETYLPLPSLSHNVDLNNQSKEKNLYPGITFELTPNQSINEPTTKGDFKFTIAKGAKIVQTGDIEITGKGYALADGEDSYIIISSNTVLAGTKIEVRGRRSLVFIGQNCRLKGVTIQVRGNDCLVVIGAGTSWESGAALCDDGKAILIGDDCMFSNQVILRTSDGHSIWEAGGSRQINTADNVIVEPHVWLGNSSRVSKGTIIGRGTIVGQLSLAAGTLKKHCIYGGIPARLIKEKVEWSRTMAYNDIPPEHLLKNEI